MHNIDVIVGFIEESQTLNCYAFVNGNPISYHDPFGLAREMIVNAFSDAWRQALDGVYERLDTFSNIPIASFFSDPMNFMLRLADGDNSGALLSGMGLILGVGNNNAFDGLSDSGNAVGNYVDDAIDGLSDSGKYDGKHVDDAIDVITDGAMVLQKHGDDVADVLGKGYTKGKGLTNKVSKRYRETFFKKHPDLKGKVVVHHAVEQQVLKKYPDLFSMDEIHDITNLRGIPNELNSTLHLSKIRKDWHQFYRYNLNPTKDDVLKYMREVDAKYGDQFKPPLK